MRCPRCSYRLSSKTERGVEVDHCTRCSGTFFDVGEAPQLLGEETRPSTWRPLWIAQKSSPSKLHCPKDGVRMGAHAVAFEGQGVVVDVCEGCQGIWLDRHEGEALRNIVGRALHHQDQALAGQRHHGVGGYLFQLFTQLPLEVWNPVRRRAWVVSLLLWLLPLFYLGQLGTAGWGASPGLVMLVPSEVSAGQHTWTLITHAFLHADALHLLGNLYFLWVFGDNVEDCLGRHRFALLYAAALLAGGVAHLLSAPQSAVPLLGASGAVAGLMGAYLVLFPRVQLWIVLFFVRFRIAAGWYLACWVLLQVAMQAAGVSGVAWVAHLGGFAAGMALALVLRPRAQLTPQPAL